MVLRNWIKMSHILKKQGWRMSVRASHPRSPPLERWAGVKLQNSLRRHYQNSSADSTYSNRAIHSTAVAVLLDIPPHVFTIAWRPSVVRVAPFASDFAVDRCSLVMIRIASQTAHAATEIAIDSTIAILLCYPARLFPPPDIQLSFRVNLSSGICDRLLCSELSE